MVSQEEYMLRNTSGISGTCQSGTYTVGTYTYGGRPPCFEPDCNNCSFIRVCKNAKYIVTCGTATANNTSQCGCGE